MGAHCMSCQTAYFIQYNVCSSLSVPQEKGLATIIVFANNQHQALSRGGSLIAKLDYCITEILRIHTLSERNRAMFGAVLGSLYTRAELYGVALHFDSYSASPPCC